MSYKNGDIVVSLETRKIFKWSDLSTKEIKKIYMTRLATPGEAGIFKSKFPGRESLSFKEFQEEMPVFDGRKLKNIVYYSISLYEGNYKFFRDFHHPKFRYAKTFEDKLDVIVSEYQRLTMKEEEAKWNKIPGNGPIKGFQRC